MLRQLCVFGLGLALAPLALQAGQVYGSVSSGGKAAAGTPIVITCAGVETKGTTGQDGSYRMNVAQEGRCTLTLPGYEGQPAVVVFSHSTPALYDLEVAKRPDGKYEVHIR